MNASLSAVRIWTRLAMATALVTAPLVATVFAPWGMAHGQTTGSSASVTLGSGPHKGKYDFAPKEACVLAAFGDKPLGLSVVMSAKDSSLSIDVPNLDVKHANEIQIVLVVADVTQGGKATASTTYEIDTRPDASLEPFKRAERANKGMTGQAKTTLMTQGNNTLLSFTGETAMGVELSGEVTCRKVQ
jgi:hypothetical protein